MNGRFSRWSAVFLVLLVATVVGYGAYNLGVSHGLAVNATLTAAAAPAPSGTPIFVYPYGWHRPWGFGLFPLLVLAFWFVAARAFFWRGRWHHHRWPGAGPDDLPPMFDQWHRRAHERMKSEPSAQ